MESNREPCSLGMQRPVPPHWLFRPPCERSTRPPGDTPGAAKAWRRSNGETVMDAVVKPWPKQPLSDHVRAVPQPAEPRPSREDAEAAVRTLIAYIGDNPDREGLVETPKRVVDAYGEVYRGYRECPVE